METVVQLSKGDIDGHVSSEKKAVKSEASEIISGYSKGNKVPETTNVKIDFSLDNLDLSELKGKATYEQIKDYVRQLQCTPEKEEAIMQALRYYEMI